MECPLGDNLKQLATEALQANEKLYLAIKRRKEDLNNDVFEKMVNTLENLRHIKSCVEGSHHELRPPDVEESLLLDLKQLTLMHVPASVTTETREKFQGLVHRLFKDKGISVLYVSLMTCPWYMCTQKERGEQAKYNVLFVVFRAPLGQIISPDNNHVHEQVNVIDKDWLFACELYHFSHFLCKGKTRNVEALYCPLNAVIFQDDGWSALSSELMCSSVMGLRGFIEACRGQSVGGIGKKGKDGKFRMRDSSTFRELCDSFRLMHHAHNAVNDSPPCTDEFDPSGIPSVAQEAMRILQSMYQNPDVSKRDVFPLLIQWQELTNKCIKDFKFTPPEKVHSIVGNWQMSLRLQGSMIQPTIPIRDDQSNLMSLLEQIGGPVANLRPEQILLITQAGSHMYGLSTATSDVDFVVIYAEPTETILTACKKIPEIIENRGPNKQIEYGAYEARCFCEMVLKGSVVILELVFKGDHNYMSPSWRALSEKKQLFISERGIQQYLGLIKNNFRMIEAGKQKNDPKERKLFYQIFHKMDSLEYFLAGKPPPVKCFGPVRDFILRVRTAPLEGDLDRDQLYSYAKAKYNKLVADLANRRNRLSENVDYQFVWDWLMSVRGLNR